LSLASYELTPVFSPSVHDYTIRCEANSRISVRHTAAADVSVRLTPAAPVSLSPGGLLSIDVATSERADSYRVRCLPQDFPELEVQGTPGVWIQTVLPAHSAHASYLVLLDEHGTPVFYKRFTSSPPFVSYISQEKLPSGLAPRGDALLEIPLEDGEFGPFSLAHDTVVTLRTLAGDVTASWKAPAGVAIDHHDAVLLQSGNLLVISYQEATPPAGIKDAPFAFAHPLFGAPGCRAGVFDEASDSFMDSVVLEITPAGRVVRSYSMAKLLGTSGISFPIRFDTDQRPDSAHCVFDAYHVNALELTKDGGLLVTGLAMDGAVLIDLESSSVSYRLGGPAASDSFSFEGDPFGAPARVHDGRLNADGTISFFDNRVAHPADHARGVLYRLDVESRKAVFVSSFPTACDGAMCMSQWGGSFRTTPNGSYVVAAGGRENGPSIEVFSKDGKQLASFSSSNVYRAIPVLPGLSRSELARLTTVQNTDRVVLDGSCSTDYFGTCR
jgi:hypothetical protein